ncbi:MAG: hypothetical protein ACK53Q_19100, partial [Dolichospermum sp.]
VALEIPSWLPQKSPRGCPRNPPVVALEIPSWLPQKSPRGCPRNPLVVAPGIPPWLPWFVGRVPKYNRNLILRGNS